MARKLHWYEKFRRCRVDAGLSLSQAVKLLYEDTKIHMHKGNLRKVEVGLSDMPVTKFKALCKVYSADANWILDLKE